MSKTAENIASKILNADTLAARLADWKSEKKQVVFTNGCFDILHLGHLDYLAKAKDLGDVLIIGLNSTESVKRLKGAHRPIQGEETRLNMLASLFFVDAVVVFEEDTPYNLIFQVQPDVLVKGGDYEPDDIVGADIVRKKGGNVNTIPFLAGHSTTKIEEKIKGMRH